MSPKAGGKSNKRPFVKMSGGLLVLLDHRRGSDPGPWAVQVLTDEMLGFASSGERAKTIDGGYCETGFEEEAFFQRVRFLIPTPRIEFRGIDRTGHVFNLVLA